MARIQLPNLPPTITLGGPELLEVVQSGVSRKATVSQITDISNAAAEAFVARLASTTYVAQFATLEAFNTIKAVADYWAVGSMVKAGPLVLEKRLAADGSRVWIVQTSDPTRTLDAYLGAQEGSVRVVNIEKADTLTVMCNPKAFASAPQHIPKETFLAMLGLAYAGNAASGSLNLPASSVTPTAPTALRTGAATSNAGSVKTVTFAQSVQGSTPNIVVTVFGTAGTCYSATVSARDGNGFGVECFSIVGGTITRVAVPFSYIAFGNGT